MPPKVTPQSLESEQLTLGTMLMDRDAVVCGMKLLSAEDFYRENHRKIFNAMFILFVRGEPVDLITVVEELRRRNYLAEVGGIAYLTALMESPVYSADIENHAKTVSEKSILRQLLCASEEIVALIFESDLSASEILRQVQGRISAIQSNIEP